MKSTLFSLLLLLLLTSCAEQENTDEQEFNDLINLQRPADEAMENLDSLLKFDASKINHNILDSVNLKPMN